MLFYVCLTLSDPPFEANRFNRGRVRVVGLQPTVIASRAPHLLLEQSVKIQKIVDVRRPSRCARRTKCCLTLSDPHSKQILKSGEGVIFKIVGGCARRTSMSKVSCHYVKWLFFSQYKFLKLGAKKIENLKLDLGIVGLQLHLTRCLRTLRARLQSHLWWPRAARAKGSG